ncbi:MAG: glutamine--tRNA ligase/YqeY domain fusion protein [Candidatus Symbiodolus clandestinus]
MSIVQQPPTHFIQQIIEADLASGRCQRVQTRFPPEPNGYLHIGHAKAICLNFAMAAAFDGRCNLRFDDTNPVTEEQRYIEAIQQDVRWLGFQWQEPIHYASDYFEQLYGYAVELIQKELAYVDELSLEEIRHYRGTLTEPGQESPYRNRSIAENLQRFEQMRAGQLPVGSACLRARIDMASSFMVLRDPVLYRIKQAKHHQTGDSWSIYPMYDFAHPISDALEQITHSLCTLEFQDNRRLYDWILEQLSIPYPPRQYEFSRLNVEYTVLSKRKLQQLVSEQIVSGWDDPRMPTLSGLRRRGYPAAALRDFCSRIGVTKQEHRVELSLLESCVRDYLNQQAPRAMAVLDPVKVVIENLAESHVEWLSMANHPQCADLGERRVPFSRELYIERNDFQEQASKQYKRLVLGERVRLRHAYVITAQRIERDIQGRIKVIYCTYDPETLGKNPATGRVRGVIHWLSVAQAQRAVFTLYDRLFSVADPESEEAWLTTINPDSLRQCDGFVEPSLQQAFPEQAYQFERLGYFCRDNPTAAPGELVFNRTVELREVWQR